MTFEGTAVVLAVVIMIVALAKEILRPGLVLFSVVILFMATGIISAEETLAGFSNKGMITVAVLFLVSEGIHQSGILNRVAQIYLPRRRGKLVFMQIRMMLPISAISAFLNNTPIVVIFAPIIKNWAEKLNLSSQKFLIPLSYATILGGMCTLIGTSTNLVVHGLMLNNGMPGFTMFELGKVGVFTALGGIIYIAILGNKLLPGQKIELKKANCVDTKDYYYDLIIPDDSNLIGHEFKNGRIRDLKNLFVRSIDRQGDIIDTQKGRFTIEAGDKLFVAGKSDGINQILLLNSVKLNGIDLVKNIPKSDLKQYEVVISPRFPGCGRTLKDYNFFDHYDAVVLAIHRNGERITSNIDCVKMKPGDNLVVLTTDKFIKNWGDSKIFYLTSFIRDHRTKGSFSTKWIAFVVLILMIIGATLGKSIYTPGGIEFDMFYFAAIAAILLIWLKILPHHHYTKAISWDILITIACSFGISKALQNSGAADSIAKTTIEFSRAFGPVGVLAALSLITALFTEIITNNAAAAVVFPIALSAANQMGVNPKPFMVAITIAASASFATPIGYQTNLIVQAVGNYKFTDFLRIGLPMNLIAFLISVLVIPLFWSF